MNKLRFALCLALLISIFNLIPVSSEAPLTISMSRVDITGFPLVSVQFSAWDENGIPLADLRPEDIYIQEGDLAEIHPQAVEPDIDAALSVALVLDVSGSMEGQPLSDAQNAAYRFLDRLNDQDQAAVIAFSDKVTTDLATLDATREIGFSNLYEGAFNLIEGLTANGGTEVYNAVEKAVKMTGALPPGHRAVLLFTDGRNDPEEVGNAESAISQAKEAGIPVFVIGLGNAIDEAYLTRLAAETGGFYRQTPRSSELSGMFNDMATLLKTNYTIHYTSSLAADGAVQPLVIRIDSTQGSASTTTSMGPLPLATPTTVPTIPPSPVPSNIPAAVIIPTTISTPPPNLYEALWQKYQTPLILAGLLLVVAMITFLNRRQRKVEKGVEKCAKCGAILKERGPCPICHSTERINTRKE